MRTVATALVLIAGAAVILWYGSTLNNSLVLGGLIGGLAALLLSIPISLTLFSHFSRRHDDRLEEQEEGTMRLAREYDYPVLPARRAYEVEAEGYTIHEVDEERYDEDYRQEVVEEPRRVSRRLPPPDVEAQRPEQRHSSTRQAINADTRLPSLQSQAYLPNPRQQKQPTSQLQQPQQGITRRKDTKVLRSTSLNTLSQHRMEAMRQARLEAAQGSDNDVSVAPTISPRQERAARTNLRTNRSSKEEETAQFQTSPRRGEPHTDYIDNQRITPLRRTPQTDQIKRRGRTGNLDASDQPQTSRDTETESIHLNRPLVRRAPYMYEDDELRQQLAQQLEPPVVRRTSRQDSWLEDE